MNARRFRFWRVCQRLGLKPACRVDQLPARRAEVDLQINRQLAGDGAAWLPRQERGQHGQ